MIRSAIITKAKGKIIQGTTDTAYSNDDWSDLYYQACELIHARLVTASTRFYVKKSTLTKNTGDDYYPLPADFFGVIELKDADGNWYSEAVEADVEQNNRAGFQRFNNNIELLGFASYPATMTLKYYHIPKEMGDYSGSADVEVTTKQYTPDPPLDDARGSRVLAKVIARLAYILQEDLNADEDAETWRIIEEFVEGARAWNKENQYLGT